MEENVECFYGDETLEDLIREAFAAWIAQQEA